MKVRYEIDLADRRPGPAPAPDGAVIRPLAPADREPLARLLLDAYAGTIDDEGETMEEALAEVDGWYGDDPLLEYSHAAFIDGELVAAVLMMVVDDAPFVAIVATAAAHKGAGWGRTVVEAALDGLARAGHERVALYITRGNTPSERLFAAAGAHPTGDTVGENVGGND